MVDPGPTHNKDGIPYDYIIIIDSGSSGSRAYIYNWLRPLELIRSTKREDDEDDNYEDINFEEDERDGDPTNPDEITYEGKLASLKLPKITTNKKWHKKVKPGISTFNKSPQDVGKKHLKDLLKLAKKVVPKAQHSRTPVFLHATAGMRLLPIEEQQSILENVCTYFRTKSAFYIPDCASHLDVLSGEVEGLLGWLSINSMIGSFENATDHDHGKNHSTYGLLDMGGALTQLVFQPNSTELEEHKEGLFSVELYDIGIKDQDISKQTFNVYSNSFLGLGMYEAQSKYLSVLVDGEGLEFSDPCLPTGYTSKEVIDGREVSFHGESDFRKCLDTTFPVLQNTTYSRECTPDEDDVSSCLLDNLIPAFDFDVNHFIGVSGYWDAITKILNYENEEVSKEDAYEYKYKLIYSKAQEVCSELFAGLSELNKGSLSQEDLSQLCFQLSWILNFLHLGLGFPRVDDTTEFKHLKLVEELDGSAFTWTLGRAILYANDEYAQAFEAISKKDVGRPGYSHNSVTVFGAEQLGIAGRPSIGLKVTPKHWFGFGLFLALVAAVVALAFGRIGKRLISRISRRFKKRKVRYTSVNDYEMDEFVIEDEEE